MNCPSAQMEPGSVVIGVANGFGGSTAVTMLQRPVALDAVRHLVPDTVPVTEVLRLSGPCAEDRCHHFAGQKCTLAARIVAVLPPVAKRPPPCAIRPRCRWWGQEGVAACLRCPQVVTEPFDAGAAMRDLASPPNAFPNPN